MLPSSRKVAGRSATVDGPGATVRARVLRVHPRFVIRATERPTKNADESLAALQATRKVAHSERCLRLFDVIHIDHILVADACVARPLFDHARALAVDEHV